MSRIPLIAGNWKQNPPREAAESLWHSVVDGCRAGDSAKVETVVFPPLPYLGLIAAASESAASGVAVGAQDLSVETWGAFTGAVGAPLLREFGATYVLVGHSERRAIFGETDAVCQAKVNAAHAGGLIPVLCVGETEAERDGNETFEVLERQLSVGLDGYPAEAPYVVAYEPVWAIGTGRTATPEQAAEAHRFLRRRLVERRGQQEASTRRILYGGSVKPGNAAALLADLDIDGALIGGASLEAASFLAIRDAAIARVD